MNSQNDAQLDLKSWLHNLFVSGIAGIFLLPAAGCQHTPQISVFDGGSSKTMNVTNAGEWVQYYYDTAGQHKYYMVKSTHKTRKIRVGFFNGKIGCPQMPDQAFEARAELQPGASDVLVGMGLKCHVVSGQGIALFPDELPKP